MVLESFHTLISHISHASLTILDRGRVNSVEKALQKEKISRYTIQYMGYYPMWMLLENGERIAIFNSGQKARDIMDKLNR